MGFNFSSINEIISQMSVGSDKAILKGLSHNGALIRINGIMFAVKFKHSSDKIITKLKELLSDNTEVDGYSVSQFATAALDVMGITKYTGNDENVLELIESEFSF